MREFEKRNQKGFTLIELLVTIVVLGIVTAMAIPMVSKIKDAQDGQKYKTYLNSMEYSAKLYVDSYKEDLFGNAENGCQVIKYSDLKAKKLIKDIGIEDVSCDSDDSLVYVEKNGNSFKYYIKAHCNGEDYKSDNYKEMSECEAKFDTTFSINVDPEYYKDKDKRKLSIDITIKNERGINPYMDVEYWFEKTKDSYGGASATTPKKLPLQVMSEAEQKERINSGSGSTIEAKATIVTPTPSDNMNEYMSGEYKLYLRLNRLITLEGKQEKNNRRQLGELYIVDNDPPKTKATLTTTVPDPKYNELDPLFKLEGGDNVTDYQDLKICTSVDANTCGENPSQGYMTVHDYFQNGNSTKQTIGTAYDNSQHTFYVSVIDSAGNVQEKQVVPYRVAEEYKITYKLNEIKNPKVTATISPTWDTVRFNNWTGADGDPNHVWGNLTSRPKAKLAEPQRDLYDFHGWNTQSYGKGMDITNNTKLTDTTRYLDNKKNLTVYAKWKPTNYNIIFAGNGSTGGSMDPIVCKYNTNCRLPKVGFIKKGHSFDKWLKETPEGEKVYYADNALTKFTDDDIDLTLKAQWTRNKYKVTYNYSANGGTSATKTIDNVYFEDNIDLTPTATKSGWTFLGWNTEQNSHTVLPELVMDDKPVTLYAIYRKEPITYSVSWNANGATLSSTRDTACTIAAVYNNEVQKTSCNVTAPTISFGLFSQYRTYDIEGFGLSKTTHTVEVSSGGTLAVKSSNNGKTYYALYSKTYTATFNGNGGSPSSPSRACKIFTTEQSCDVETPTASHNKGYYFFTWGNRTTDTSENIGAKKTLTLTGNKTLYAIWYDTVSYSGTTSSATKTISNVRARKSENASKGSVSVSKSGSTLTVRITGEYWEEDYQDICTQSFHTANAIRDSSTSYSCPSGYEQSGTTCTKTDHYSNGEAWYIYTCWWNDPSKEDELIWQYNSSQQTNHKCPNGNTGKNIYCPEPTEWWGPCANINEKVESNHVTCTYDCIETTSATSSTTYSDYYCANSSATRIGQTCYICDSSDYDYNRSSNTCEKTCTKVRSGYKYNVDIEYFI